MESASVTREESGEFWKIGLQTIRELEHEQGVLASGREEIYGCIFGRDSLITSLELLRAYSQTSDAYLLVLVRKVLVNLLALQGREVNIESGEEPGKCIHEFRTENHAHLTQRAARRWFLYPDRTMRNFDSVDATPLLLIAVYRYWQKSGDGEFLRSALDGVKLSLRWLLEYGDKNGDGFIDYQLSPERVCGGLVTQNWMDSSESVFHEDGSAVAFPVAPVEVQAYGYLALRLWYRYFLGKDDFLAAALERRAKLLKENFNLRFILHGSPGGLASGIDGSGKPLVSARSSMGHCLWAAEIAYDDGLNGCVVADEYIPVVARRLLRPDLFEPQAGIRTLSKLSRCFEANSYHNGSIWPHDCSIVAAGLENFGFSAEATQVRRSLLSAFRYFRTPVELFAFDNGQFAEYVSPSGQMACRTQAWSAAAWLADGYILREELSFNKSW